MAEGELLLFTKAAAPGRVKTRLVPPLTAEQASAVHEASLRDTVEGTGSAGARLVIVYDGTPGAEEWFARRFPDLDARPQCAGDLGARLENGFAQSFAAGAEWVIAIGADSPTLPRAYLKEAIDTVRERNCAIGPTEDGGYYLIGLAAAAWPAAARLFHEIPWSTERVFPATARRASEVGVSLTVLPPWYDIDRFEDLRRALAEAEEGSMLGALRIESLSP